MTYIRNEKSLDELFSRDLTDAELKPNTRKKRDGTFTGLVVLFKPNLFVASVESRGGFTTRSKANTWAKNKLKEYRNILSIKYGKEVM